MRFCASSRAALTVACPASADWIAVASVSPTAGHCGTRGRQSTSVSLWSDASVGSTKLSPKPRITSTYAGSRHSEVRFTPERLAGPAKRCAVRACVSSLAAHWMKSQVAFLRLSVSAALMGKPQFQIELTRLPEGPLGQRAYATLPMTLDFSALLTTEADEWASM